MNRGEKGKLAIWKSKYKIKPLFGNYFETVKKKISLNHQFLIK